MNVLLLAACINACQPAAAIQPKQPAAFWLAQSAADEDAPPAWAQSPPETEPQPAQPGRKKRVDQDIIEECKRLGMWDPSGKDRMCYGYLEERRRQDKGGSSSGGY